MTVRPHHPGSAAALLALLPLALSACGTTPSKGASAEPAIEAPPDYPTRVHARIDAGKDAEYYTLRYNPVACDCPSFEVLLGEHWQRVAFDTSDEEDETLVALRQAISEANPADRVVLYEVQGSLDDQLATCGRGLIYVTMTPKAFGRPPVEPPEPDEDTEEVPAEE